MTIGVEIQGLITPEKGWELQEHIAAAEQSRWFHMSGLVGGAALELLQSEATRAFTMLGRQVVRVENPEANTMHYRASYDKLILANDPKLRQQYMLTNLQGLADELTRWTSNVSNYVQLNKYYPGTMFEPHEDLELDKTPRVNIAVVAGICEEGILQIYPNEVGDEQAKPANIKLAPGDIAGLLSVDKDHEVFRSLWHAAYYPGNGVRITEAIALYGEPFESVKTIPT